MNHSSVTKKFIEEKFQTLKKQLGKNFGDGELRSLIATLHCVDVLEKKIIVQHRSQHLALKKGYFALRRNIRDFKIIRNQNRAWLKKRVRQRKAIGRRSSKVFTGRQRRINHV